MNYPAASVQPITLGPFPNTASTALITSGTLAITLRVTTTAGSTVYSGTIASTSLPCVAGACGTIPGALSAISATDGCLVYTPTGTTDTGAANENEILITASLTSSQVYFRRDQIGPAPANVIAVLGSSVQLVSNPTGESLSETSGGYFQSGDTITVTYWGYLIISGVKYVSPTPRTVTHTFGANNKSFGGTINSISGVAGYIFHIVATGSHPEDLWQTQSSTGQHGAAWMAPARSPRFK